LDIKSVTLEFKDRFYNTRHMDNRWLNAVKSYADVEPNYDDKYGKRTTQRIDNVNGMSIFM